LEVKSALCTVCMKLKFSVLLSEHQEKSWNETFQLVRRCMDKSRDESKPCEPLMRSMQRLQEVFNVSSINGMKTRLETIAKQQGLGFHVRDGTCYLTADLFYLEVVLLPCGEVEVVKVAPLGGAPVPSESFLEVLRSKDFAKFSKRLGDLFSQYNIPGDNELKLKLFESLQALGKDLEQISHLPRTSVDPSSQTDHINNGIVGTVTFGKEGHILFYKFVHFYLICASLYKSHLTLYKPSMTYSSALSVPEAQVHTAQLTIGLSDVPHRLQVASSISQPPQLDAHGYNLPQVYYLFSHTYAVLVPACFLLKLEPAVAMVLLMITDIFHYQHRLLLLNYLHSYIKQCYLNLFLSCVQTVEGRMHTYVFPAEAWEGHRGTLVDTVSFTHLSHVPALLKVLRHQCAINSALMSAITPKCPSLFSELHFEVLPETNTTFASIMYNIIIEHPVTLMWYDVCSIHRHFCNFSLRCHSLPMTLQTLYSKLKDHATALSSYAAVSVSQSELVPEINPSPPVDPYPIAPVGVFSPWMTNNDQLAELI
uniref:Mediator of RNA polymerase II transcription subunit 1 n=1 Tax=Periophthalmus magnuspinnatus TaxID=409849 RepID=A0A3B3Z8J3_9GOBI